MNISKGPSLVPIEAALGEMEKLLVRGGEPHQDLEDARYGSPHSKTTDLDGSMSTSRRRRQSPITNHKESLAQMRLATKNVYEQYDGSIDRDDPNLPLYALLAKKASPPDIDQQDFIKRSTFMLISLLKLCACIVWGLMYLTLNDRGASVMPFFYLCFVLSNFTYCAIVEDGYERFVIVQLSLILIFPMLVHLVLGGLQGSGGVMLWSILSPLGAAFFRSSEESKLWFKIYLGLTLILIAIEFIPGYAAVSSPDMTTGFWMMNIIGVMSIVFSAAFFFAQALESEYQRSEALLDNILPQTIAKRIKCGENPIVDKHEKISLLFCDIVGFTTAASTMDPTILIEKFLEQFFFGVDQCVEKRHLTKIKTIGDAYMVAGGLETREGCLNDVEHVFQLLGLAADMFSVLDDVNKSVGTNLQIRIGIHVGPVIAGVLGTQRFAYDVWGDAVNIASRMESSGKASMIHLSEQAYEAVKTSTDFMFEDAGESQIKGKGKMSTFLAVPKHPRRGHRD